MLWLAGLHPLFPMLQELGCSWAGQALWLVLYLSHPRQDQAHRLWHSLGVISVLYPEQCPRARSALPIGESSPHVVGRWGIPGCSTHCEGAYLPVQHWPMAELGARQAPSRWHNLNLCHSLCGFPAPITPLQPPARFATHPLDSAQFVTCLLAPLHFGT